MTMCGIDIDDEAMLAQLTEHRKRLRGMKDLKVPLPPEMKSDLIEQGAELFGETRFLDMLIVAMSDKGSDELAMYVEFVDAVIGSVQENGVAGWLFRILWDADLAATESLLSDGDDVDSIADLRGYLVDVCAMAATVALRFVRSDEQATGLALLLLGGKHDDALNLLLPQSNIALEPESLHQVSVELNRQRVARDSTGHAAESNAVSDERLIAEPDDAVSEDDAGDRHLAFPERLYVFDASHIIRSYRLLWQVMHESGTMPDQPDAWCDRDFAYDKLVSVAGLGLVSEPLDGSLENGDAETFQQSLEILESYVDCVRAHGLVRLPGYVITTIADTMRLDDDASIGESFDRASTIRRVCFDMAAVMLARVPDAVFRRRLALDLVSLDIDRYFSDVDGTDGGGRSA